MPKFPQFSKASRTGELGVNLVTQAFCNDFQWIFKRNHGEHDFGIDGHVEIVDKNGLVTGKSIAVQIKCGSSFFKNFDEYGFFYIGEEKHLNYLLNYPMPVLILICDPISQVIYWEHFKLEATQKVGKKWKLHIPKAQTLSFKNKEKVELIAGKSFDYTEKLEEYWQLNNVIEKSNYLFITIAKDEIDNLEIVPINSFFERLSNNKPFARKNRNKVVLVFFGYDDDERELFEIENVVRWCKLAEQEIDGWFYFLTKEINFYSMVIFAACCCGAKKINDDGIQFTNPQDLVSFIKRNFLRMNAICEHLELSEDVIKEMSMQISNIFLPTS